MWCATRVALGTTLFIIYLNDFQKFLEFSKANRYVDDTHVTLTSNNVDDLIRNAHRELRNIAEWMRVNKLKNRKHD